MATLLCFSAPAQAATALTNGVPVYNIGGAQGSMTMFQISVPAGATNLSFVTSGGSGGDVDIFAKFNALPTPTYYDAKSDGPTRSETINIATPQAGTYYLLMYGDWSTYAGVTLVASYKAPSGTTTLTNGVPVYNIGGVQGSMTMFQIAVPTGATNLSFVTSGGSGGDVDIFAKFNALPTPTYYDAKSDGPTRSETINIAAPQAGTYYLLMYGDWSTYAGVTLTASYTTAATIAPPSAPTGVVATAGNAQASVSFAAAAGNGSAVTGYTVTSSPPGGIDSNAGSTALNHVVTGLSNGTGYTFTVVATNAAGTSAPSSASNSVTPSGPPGSPTAVAAVAGNAQATVSFAAPASNGGSAITGYTVISNPAGGTDSNQGSTALSHAVTGLVNGTSYTFTVVAKNAVGTSAPSSPSASVTPAAPSTGATMLSNGVPVYNIGGAQGSMQMFQISVPAGATNLSFVTSGGSGGDVDIYAKYNALPSPTSYDAGSYGPTRSETINIATPQAGTYYLLMYGDWSTYAGVTLVASYTAPSSTPTTSTVTLTNGVPVSGIGGAQGSMKLYTLSVPSGASNLKFVTTGGTGGDVDMYVKYSLPVSTTSFDWSSTGPTPAETITVSTPQAGTYNVLLYGDWSTYAGVTLTASYSTGTSSPPPSCTASSSTVTPAIATQAAWDAKFDGLYGSTLPDLSGGAETFAWQGHYWVRAYVSMAKTYGATKYLDRAVGTIDYWFAHQETSQGWGASINPAQMMLDTGVIGQAIAIFAYEVWNDPRFVAYRPKADAYVTQLESILHTYDYQWVEAAPYPGSPNFYVYATCGGLCGPGSLVMYNQGASMAKALLLIDRIYRLKGLTPDAGYLHKADSAAAYFKTFVRQNGSAYLWDYGGAVPNSGTEDTDHGHLDLSLVVWAKNFGLGGLTNTDMASLAGTMHVLLNGAAGPNDVSTIIDGTGLPTSNWDRVAAGFDWIELADYDSTLLDKTINVFNLYMSNPNASRFFLGWAEIQRKKSCVGL